MQIPRLLCGNGKQVAAACRKHITRFMRGASWSGLGGELIDDRDAPGLVSLNGPSPLLVGESNVHAYAPFWELAKALAKGRIARTEAARGFDEALEHPWSILGLLSQANYRWFDAPGRAEAFLVAMARHWHALDAVGPRYTMGSQLGQRLWEVPLLHKYVLANRGIPRDALHRPLPGGDLAALVAATRASC
jgi:hypothetical protein